MGICFAYDESNNALNVTTNVTLNINSNCETCPKGWTKYGRYCYRASAFTVTFDDGLKYCNGIGASVATINSDKENLFFITTFGTSWVNAIRMQETKVFVKFEKCYYLSCLAYTKWGPNQPSNNGTNLNCVVFCVDNSGNWCATSCEDKYKIICKISCSGMNTNLEIFHDKL
ncbi:C-type lectin-like protein [Leptotrombidium deliense]|uniref:C-type lectin-like protein n=1 Tax=Leptotrombidium deliense TaxID=299467 RepID=A0A443RW60_9ACAR|nr:C-type lectin-like protein [Leptotrombidium deliense]